MLFVTFWNTGQIFFCYLETFKDCLEFKQKRQIFSLRNVLNVQRDGCTFHFNSINVFFLIENDNIFISSLSAMTATTTTLPSTFFCKIDLPRRRPADLRRSLRTDLNSSNSNNSLHNHHHNSSSNNNNHKTV